MTGAPVGDMKGRMVGSSVVAVVDLIGMVWPDAF